MLTRIANLGIRAPKRVLAVAALLLVAAAAYGISVVQDLSAGGFNDPSSESQRASQQLTDTFGAGEANLVLTIDAPGGADSVAARAAARDVVAGLRGKPFVEQVTSYVGAPRAAGLVSTDGRTGLVIARVAGGDKVAPDRAADVADPLTGTRDGVKITAGGQAIAYHGAYEATTDDLLRSEAIAVPITILVLIVIFGSLFAALLPAAVGIVSIVGTMALLRLLTLFTDVSTYALNMTTALGLALAIDYSLLIVSRYREELGNGADPADAVRTTMRTSGRTVLFSALTVGLSLAAMTVFPMYFLRSFAYAGVAVVLLATVAALVLLPAVLTLVGPRIDKLDLRRGVRRALGRPEPTPKAIEQTGWYRFAQWVMKRALPVAVLVTAFLVALGLPFLNGKFSYPDDRVLPPSASSHQVGDQLRNDFPINITGTISVVAPDTTDRFGTGGDLGRYVAAVSRLPDAATVTSAAGVYQDGRRVAPGNRAMSRGDATYLQVNTAVDPDTDRAKDLLAGVRAVPAPWPTLVTGFTAQTQDSLSELGDALPWALGLIAVATLIVLFLLTGSLLLPIKALVLNTLSLSATFGAMVWVFQEGHLASWLFPDLTVTGQLTATMPPLMFCIAFGLSMDYEVFLLSRIREEYHATGDNTRAVALGLGRTGRIVTAAALLMAIVFASIATSSVSFMMLFGTGLTLAVLMDATVVRGMLVPAFMRLAGRWNWWAPGPLARFHDRYGLHEAPRAGDTSEVRELART